MYSTKSQFCNTRLREVAEDKTKTCLLVAHATQPSAKPLTSYGSIEARETSFHRRTLTGAKCQCANLMCFIIKTFRDLFITAINCRLNSLIMSSTVTLQPRLLQRCTELYFTDNGLPRRCHMGSPIDGIELVTHCKLLGVIVQDTFSVEMHVNYILSICS